MVIRSIGVFSCAKIMGALYGAIGFIMGAFFALFSMIGTAVAPDASVGIFSAMFGVGAVILLPLFYGVLGFIGGVVTALLYNVVAGVVGGIELETE